MSVVNIQTTSKSAATRKLRATVKHDPVEQRRTNVDDQSHCFLTRRPDLTHEQFS